DDAAGRTGDEIGLHRPARAGARAAPEILRHGHRAVPAQVRSHGRGSAHDPRRGHRAAARTSFALAGDRRRVEFMLGAFATDRATTSWLGLSRPSTSFVALK